MKQTRKYQHNFSAMLHETMYDREGRERKAKTIVAVLSDFFQSGFYTQSLLDVGCSTGIMSNYLAGYFGKVVGIDIDEPAISFAKKSFKQDNLEFVKSDSLRMNFSENTFDIVTCAHVYEHVPDASKLMGEIYRVLKPGGVCYFSAGNRLNVIEPHYNLPFLSLLPKGLANRYVKYSGKAELYYEKHLSYWGLKNLIRKFELVDYTKKIIQKPRFFHADYMIRPGSLTAGLAKLVVRHAYWLCPTYIWLLLKVG